MSTPSSRRPLSLLEREEISRELAEGLEQTEIAERIDRCPEARRGRFTTRADLAASTTLLDGRRHIRTTVGVITTVGNPTLLRRIRGEALAHPAPPAGLRRAPGAP
ncbi:hypothetical protein ABT072_45760 [Streptomyces sp. NPDC002589]|uniref:hypothetical protein n=1 Tax=Streptomyces sp. NPDC002589 TaxID=3154420 RepID=UPI00331DF2A8